MQGQLLIVGIGLGAGWGIDGEGYPFEADFPLSNGVGGMLAQAEFHAGSLSPCRTSGLGLSQQPQRPEVSIQQ